MAGRTAPGRDRTTEPAHRNARTLRRNRERLSEGKEVNTRPAAPLRLASMQVRRLERWIHSNTPSGVCHPLRVSLSPVTAPRCRGHSALQPTTIPRSQQSPRPQLLQLHVLQGLGGPAERRGRPPEPCRHGTHHHGGLPSRR